MDPLVSHDDVLKTAEGLWWDLGAMTTADVYGVIACRAPFVVDVDPVACCRMWGHPWRRVCCRPVAIGRHLAWSVVQAPAFALPALALPPVGDATAAAQAEGLEADDGAACKPAPSSHSCATFSPHLSMSCSIVPPTPPSPTRGAMPAPALGTEKSTASRGAR